MVLQQVVLPLDLALPLLILIPPMYLRCPIDIFRKVILILLILFFLLMVYSKPAGYFWAAQPGNYPFHPHARS
jgi:hypothetical protein